VPLTALDEWEDKSSRSSRAQSVRVAMQLTTCSLARTTRTIWRADAGKLGTPSNLPLTLEMAIAGKPPTTWTW